MTVTPEMIADRIPKNILSKHLKLAKEAQAAFFNAVPTCRGAVVVAGGAHDEAGRWVIFGTVPEPQRVRYMVLVGQCCCDGNAGHLGSINVPVEDVDEVLAQIGVTRDQLSSPFRVVIGIPIV